MVVQFIAFMVKFTFMVGGFITFVVKRYWADYSNEL